MSRMLGYTQREGDPVLYPDPRSPRAKTGAARTQVIPRSRTADVMRLAKANGWSEAEAKAKADEVVARFGHDSYIPKTKAVTRVQPIKRSPTWADNPLMSAKTDGDYVGMSRDDLTTAVSRPAGGSVRDRVRQAVALGLIAAEDAPSWAREGRV